MSDSVAYSSRQPTPADLPFNSNIDQKAHSLARFNAGCYRRVAYKNTLDYPQRRCHESTSFGAFMSERILGCPASWTSEEDFRDYMEDHVYVNPDGYDVQG